MNSQYKYFLKYLFTLSLVLIFCGCSFFGPPYQQIRYSNDPRLGILKVEMNKEEAVRILKIYIKDNTETQHYLGAIYTGITFTEHSTRKNTIVNEESISYDTTYGIDSTTYGPDMDDPDQTKANNMKGKPMQSSFVMKYKDVKKIKLFTYKEIFGSYYKLYLYDKSNKTIFWFSVPFKNQGEKNVYKLLAALSVLIPHAQEEYNEYDTKSYINPQFK